MARLTSRRRLELQCWAQSHEFGPCTTLPEDWPQEWRLEPGIWPLDCGDHATGFIGLYAIINGLAVLLAETEPLKPAEQRMLLDQGWRFLADRGLLAPWKGIRISTLERMARSLVYTLCRRRECWIRCERVEVQNFECDIFALTLERLIVAKRIVIILLGRSHHTVLRGFTPASWLLFDAGGRMWIKRSRRQVFAELDWRRPRPFALAISRSI